MTSAQSRRPFRTAAPSPSDRDPGQGLAHQREGVPSAGQVSAALAVNLRKEIFPALKPSQYPRSAGPFQMQSPPLAASPELEADPAPPRRGCGQRSLLIYGPFFGNRSLTALQGGQCPAN